MTLFKEYEDNAQNVIDRISQLNFYSSSIDKLIMNMHSFFNAWKQEIQYLSSQNNILLYKNDLRELNEIESDRNQTIQMMNDRIETIAKDSLHTSKNKNLNQKKDTNELKFENYPILRNRVSNKINNNIDDNIVDKKLIENFQSNLKQDKNESNHFLSNEREEILKKKTVEFIFEIQNEEFSRLYELEKLFNNEIHKYNKRSHENNYKGKYERMELFEEVIYAQKNSENILPKSISNDKDTSNEKSIKVKLSSNKRKDRQHYKVTSNLQKTKSLLSNVIDNSDQSQEILSEMSNLLKHTLKRQEDYHISLNQSKKKITSLKKRSNIDYYVNKFAFYFFIAVCIYIFNKRLKLISLIFHIIWSILKLFMFWRWFDFSSTKNEQDLHTIKL